MHSDRGRVRYPVDRHRRPLVHGRSRDVRVAGRLPALDDVLRLLPAAPGEVARREPVEDDQVIRAAEVGRGELPDLGIGERACGNEDQRAGGEYGPHGLEQYAVFGAFAPRRLQTAASSKRIGSCRIRWRASTQQWTDASPAATTAARSSCRGRSWRTAPTPGA